MPILKLNNDIYEKIRKHLIRSDTKLEQVGFLFCKTYTEDDNLFFDVLDKKFLNSDEIEVQSEFYLELSKDTFRKIVVQAINLNASIVEMHSHTSNGKAEFSFTDKVNLIKTVEYLGWRVGNRPYMAIVMTRSDYDALVWTNIEKSPESLSAIQVESEAIRPTNLTLRSRDYD